MPRFRPCSQEPERPAHTSDRQRHPSPRRAELMLQREQQRQVRTGPGERRTTERANRDHGRKSSPRHEGPLRHHPYGGQPEHHQRHRDRDPGDHPMRLEVITGQRHREQRDRRGQRPRKRGPPGFQLGRILGAALGRRSVRRLPHRGAEQHPARHDQQHGAQEHPAPAELLGHQAGQHRTEHRRQDPHRREQREHLRPQYGGQRTGDQDHQGDVEQPFREAAEQPSGDHHRHRGRRTDQQLGQGERDRAGPQGRDRAATVGPQTGDRERDQVARHRGRVGQAEAAERVELAHHRRQRRTDRAVLERAEGDESDHAEDERQVPAAEQPLGGRGGRGGRGHGAHPRSSSGLQVKNECSRAGGRPGPARGGPGRRRSPAGCSRTAGTG